MSLQPVDRVLKRLRQTQWQQQRQFDQLVQAWAEIVGPAVAAQTQPIQISAQRVLVVATASAVWAQNLAFERHRMLTKLNEALDDPLTDIRFSTSQWRLRTARKRVAKSWTPKNLVAKATDQGASLPPAQTYQQAFERWSETVKTQAQPHPICPQCQCHAPIAELQRWSVCALCWVRPPTEPPDLRP